jgi:hypothetical protein
MTLTRVERLTPECEKRGPKRVRRGRQRADHRALRFRRATAGPSGVR